MRKGQSKTQKILIRLVNQVLDLHFLAAVCVAGFLGYALIDILTTMVKQPVPMPLYYGSIFGACLLVAVFRWDWPALMKELSIDEEAVRRAVEADAQYHEARLEERKENYRTAAALYEKVLAHDGSHMQARFGAARMYIEKLNDRESGLRHARVLAATAPDGHPYRRYAKEQVAKADDAARSA